MIDCEAQKLGLVAQGKHYIISVLRHPSIFAYVLRIRNTNIKMTRERVVSKHLFNFVPQGRVDDDIKQNLPSLWSVVGFVIGVIQYLIYLFVSKFVWNINFKVRNHELVEAFCSWSKV